MPLIQIKSLPLEEGLSISDILEGFSRGFSEQAGVEIGQVMVTWEALPYNIFIHAGMPAAGWFSMLKRSCAGSTP